jgi:isoamylase
MGSLECTMKIWPGHPYPLGATWDGSGVNFALFSENATAVELCLFDDAGRERRVRLTEQTDRVWHVYLPEARPGQLYGYRVYGPHSPREGHRFNPAKLLRDPYARAVSGTLQWNDALYGYTIGSPEADLSCDHRDSAPFMPKCAVIDSAFTWGSDERPRTPWDRTIIYELHVKGFTRLNPLVSPEARGTFAGLATPEVIEHLLSLGITAVELMPVQQFIHDRYLVERGLSNFWGYTTINYFAPHAEYASLGDRGEQVAEFKTMVKTLHREGIEVILDVVYNHTGEGNHLGPTLCFRGVDNRSYYRLNPNDLRHYADFSGIGNSLNLRHPRTLQFLMDSLRYWVEEMHVDGFRFDLAATLARELHGVERLSTFFEVIHQDPVVSQVKLIAEPWDLGHGGYQVGNFPVLWTEWNDAYRDTVRRYWKGDSGQVGNIAYRLTGSSDLYESTGRRPYASINFVTAHDGFCLRDLVSYDRKHNEENGFGNSDGIDQNFSWNCGVEGPTKDPAVLSLRARQQRNFMATLLLSQGVPMLHAGDELGQTKRGNNNSFCQDNDLSWLNWEFDPEQKKLLEFVKKVLWLRRKHPVFHRRSFFRGRAMRDPNLEDVAWHRPDGREMAARDWTNPDARCLGMLLSGYALEECDERGNPIADDTFLVLLNSYWGQIPFTLPPPDGKNEVWRLTLDTTNPAIEPLADVLRPGDRYLLQPRSLCVLQAFRIGSPPEAAPPRGAPSDPHA